MKLFSVIIFVILSGCSKSLHTQQLLSDVKELSSDKYKGRKTGTAENAKAADYIIERYRQVGIRTYSNDYRQPFNFRDQSNKTITGKNLIGYVPGKKEDVIVISAHYDHVGTVNGEIYNGADDNASGVAAMLKIAEHFVKNQPEHTLVFAAFDAEELGLQGAKAFVKNPPLPINRIKMNVNLDMISRSERNELYVVGTYHYPLLKSHVVTKSPKIKLLFGHDNPGLGKNDWTNQSDHGAFHEKKIPFLYFGVEDHADYHKPTDDYEKIHPKFYKNAVQAITEVVENLDKSITLQKIHRDKLIMN